MRKAVTGGPTAQPVREQSQLGSALRPLLIDVAIPLVLYYVLHGGAKLGTVESLFISSVVPGLRTVVALVRERSINGLALLMFVVTLAGAAISVITGDARLMLAKESLGTGVIGLSIGWSAFTSQPLMNNAIRPFMTKGAAAKEAAWQALNETSPEFRRSLSRVSLLWGVGLLSDCVLRVVGAFTLPVSTMVWMSTVILVAAIGVLVAGTGVVSDRAEKLLEAQSAEKVEDGLPAAVRTAA
ncbi:VC0807 family protein [Streptacidiphilus albus]|uniref:VC0807 family protein n=1 Tax=Streptacidiphilus albus TaxID=105425 RepID=UPI0005A7DFB9|nr:VC0807 family protein [Streptacidiphilus albus]